MIKLLLIFLLGFVLVSSGLGGVIIFFMIIIIPSDSINYKIYIL